MKKILLTLMLANFCVFAENNIGYLKQDQNVDIDGKNVGLVSVLTPVKILKMGSEKSDIVLSGYVQEYYQAKLVKSPEIDEQYMSFEIKEDVNSYDGDTNPYLKIIGEKKDGYGENWLQAEIQLSVPTASIEKDPNVLYNQAKSLYEQTCSACHLLHEPNQYTANQWPSNIDSMIGLGFVALEDLDKSMVIKYLQHNAKDAK